MRIELRRVVEDKSTKVINVDKRVYWQVVLVGTNMERIQDNMVSQEAFAKAEASYWSQLLGWPIIHVEVSK